MTSTDNEPPRKDFLCENMMLVPRKIEILHQSFEVLAEQEVSRKLSDPITTY